MAKFGLLEGQSMIGVAAVRMVLFVNWHAGVGRGGRFNFSRTRLCVSDQFHRLSDDL